MGTRGMGVPGNGASLGGYPWYGSGCCLATVFSCILAVFPGFWPNLAVFGCISGFFWPNLAVFGPYLAVFSPYLAVFGHCLTVFGHCWAVFVHCLAVFGHGGVWPGVHGGVWPGVLGGGARSPWWAQARA